MKECGTISDLLKEYVFGRMRWDKVSREVKQDKFL